MSTLQALLRAIVTARAMHTSSFNVSWNCEVGECLVFSPTAMLDIKSGLLEKLGMSHIKMKTRERLTADGGRSVMATSA